MASTSIVWLWLARKAVDCLRAIRPTLVGYVFNFLSFKNHFKNFAFVGIICSKKVVEKWRIQRQSKVDLTIFLCWTKFKAIFVNFFDNFCFTVLIFGVIFTPLIFLFAWFKFLSFTSVSSWAQVAKFHY